MTPRHARTALRSHFRSAGFVEEGTRFVYQTPELQHSVEVTAVRRLSGFVELLHQVSAKGHAEMMLSEELASHGHNSPYPRIWSATSIDPSLVLDQVSAIIHTFQTLNDVAHFYSDRPHARTDATLGHAASPAKAHSLSAADACRELMRLAREILGQGFSLVRQNDEFELWVSNEEVEGFRHCAYVEANYSCTLAVVVYFALPAGVIARGFRHDDARRRLLIAPKRVFFDAGRPVLVSLSHSSPRDTAAIGAALLAQLQDHPPNLLSDDA